MWKKKLLKAVLTVIFAVLPAMLLYHKRVLTARMVPERST